MRGRPGRRNVLAAVLTVIAGLATAGPAGAAGITQVRSDKQPLPAGETGAAKASCPGDTSVTGGGVSITDANTATAIHSSYPVDGGDRDTKPDDGWRAVANSRSAAPKKLRAFALCAKSGKYSYREIDGVVDPGMQGGSVVPCPTGRPVAGGGGKLAGNNTSSGLAVTEPWDSDADMLRDDGWTTAANNGSSGAINLTIFAICSKSGSFTYPKVAGSAGAFQQSSAQMFCPQGAAVTGGGGNTGTGTTTAELATSEPISNPSGGGQFVYGWSGTVNNNSGVPLDFSTSLVCRA